MGLGPKILITGGLGNLGSWLTEYFVNAGFETTVLASRMRKMIWGIEPEIILCDILDRQKLNQNLKARAFDFVLHTASVNDHFVDDYSNLALEVNVKGTKNLIEALNIESLKNFIYFSTFHAYGKSGVLTEEVVPSPKNDYGLTHLLAEHYVEINHFQNQLPFTNIRLSNSYGCPKDYDSSKWYLILNDLSKMAFEYGQISLKSNGKAKRDFIWMGDVCQIIHELVKLPATNTTYNISGERTYAMLEVANAVQQAFMEWKGDSLPLDINKEDKNEYEDDLVISSAKIKTLIDYDAQPHFKEEALKIFEFLSKKAL